MKRSLMMIAALSIFISGCAGRNYQPWTQAFVVMQLACPPSVQVSLENADCKILSQKVVPAEIDIRPEGSVGPGGN